MKKIIILTIFILAITNITACKSDTLGNNTQEKNNKVENITKQQDEKDIDSQPKYELTEEGIIKSDSAKEIIEEEANKLIQAISIKDTETIADYVHPVKGVRFTPYTNVSVEKDIVFSKEQVKNFFNDTNTYIWGVYDGIGDDIALTPSEYYNKFIYSKDFNNPEKIGYNETFGNTNMIENQYEVYDTPIVVEYYFSGFNPEYGGLDWQSLRLVFELYNDEWKLVGIIHNQWTI